MLYDLNIAWSPSTTPDQLRQTLILAASFGYGTVALNHTLASPAQTKQQPQAASPFPPTSTLLGDGASGSKIPHVLHRATIPVADPAAPNYRILTLMNAYDILAVRPTTEAAFQHACITLDMPIISLDLTQQFPFHFRPKPCMAAVSRGVRFEICYGQALSAVDARGRSVFIGNATSLIRATRGRGIVISSEAKSALGLRAPADVVNLMNVWGLPNDKGMQGLGAIARSVVVNEGIKRSGFRGVVNVVQRAELPRGEEEEQKNSGDAMAREHLGTQKSGIKGKNGNGKRIMESDGNQGTAKKQVNKKAKVVST